MFDRSITLGHILRFCIVLALITVFIGYILWQSRLLLTGPVLTLTTPIPATSSSSTVLVEGVAENIVWITINGRNILTSAAGDFKEYIYLENGYTIVQLEAADRYGRQTIETFPIVASPLATSTETSSNQS